MAIAPLHGCSSAAGAGSVVTARLWWGPAARPAARCISTPTPALVPGPRPTPSCDPSLSPLTPVHAPQPRSRPWLGCVCAGRGKEGATLKTLGTTALGICLSSLSLHFMVSHPSFELLASCCLLYLSQKITFLVAIKSAKRLGERGVLMAYPPCTVFQRDKVFIRLHL